jgi:hypothetical protein
MRSEGTRSLGQESWKRLESNLKGVPLPFLLARGTLEVHLPHLFMLVGQPLRNHIYDSSPDARFSRIEQPGSFSHAASPESGKGLHWWSGVDMRDTVVARELEVDGASIPV